MINGVGVGGGMLVQTHTATISVLREKNREVLIFILDIPLYCTYKLHNS